MLPLVERLEFRRRYSWARDYFASRFTHGHVLEFFSGIADHVKSLASPNAKAGLSRGMAQSGQLGKHTRSWREASVIGDDWNSNSDGLRKHRSCGCRCQNDGRGKSFYLVIDILHLSGPIAHLRRSCNNQTGIRSPVFPSRQNATSRFSERRFGTRGRNEQLGKKAE